MSDRPSLGFKLYFGSKALEHGFGALALSPIKNIAFADEGECNVRKLDKIAARPYGTMLRHHGYDALVDKSFKVLKKLTDTPECPLARV